MDKNGPQEEQRDSIVAHALGLDGPVVLKPNKYERTLQDWMSESAQESCQPEAPEEAAE